MRTRPWELSDDQWEHFGPLIPERPGRDPNKEYQRKPGGGRRAADPRRTLEGILDLIRDRPLLLDLIRDRPLL